jgi:hypothetical protein
MMLRELIADELENVGGGNGLGLAAIAALSACPRNNYEIGIAFGFAGILYDTNQPPAPFECPPDSTCT